MECLNARSEKGNFRPDTYKLVVGHRLFEGLSWSWSYGSWIYNYLCNQCLSPLMLWVRIMLRVRCTTLCDTVCQSLATSQWFSPGTPVSCTNKTDHHDITEILLKVALNTIKQTNKNRLFEIIIKICWYRWTWNKFHL